MQDGCLTERVIHEREIESARYIVATIAKGINLERNRNVRVKYFESENQITKPRLLRVPWHYVSHYFIDCHEYVSNSA